MGRFSSDTGGGDFKQPEPGTHVARCYSLIDLGTQRGEYLGEPTSRNQVIVRWELPYETELFEGVSKPLIVSKFYTNSLSEKANLRKDLESWRSRAFSPEELMKFDLLNILGKACILSVVHSDKGKAKVVSVSALTKGSTCPPQFNPSSSFWLDPWNEEAFRALPAGFQRIIEKSDEYRSMFAGAKRQEAPKATANDEWTNDVPFSDDENSPPF